MPTRTIFKLHSITLLIITLSDPHHFLFLFSDILSDTLSRILSHIHIICYQLDRTHYLTSCLT